MQGYPICTHGQTVICSLSIFCFPELAVGCGGTDMIWYSPSWVATLPACRSSKRSVCCQDARRRKNCV